MSYLQRWHCSSTPRHCQLYDCKAAVSPKGTSGKQYQIEVVPMASGVSTNLQSLPIGWQFGLQTLTTDPDKLLFRFQVKTKPLSIVSNLCIQAASLESLAPKHTTEGAECLASADLLMKAHSSGRCLPAKGCSCPASKTCAGLLWRLATATANCPQCFKTAGTGEQACGTCTATTM